MSKKGNCLLLILVAFSLAIIFQACSSTSEAKPGYYASGYMGKINASVAAVPLSGDFETPPILKASEYLPEKIRKSRYHTVEEKIYTDGFSNRYRLNSTFIVNPDTV